MNPQRDQSTVDQMRAGMAGMADEAIVVDLHERVLRTARRSAVRRSVASVTAVFLVVAGLGVAAWRFLPAQRTPPVSDTSTARDTRLTYSELQEATLTMPPWPEPSAGCRSGPFTLVDGVATTPGRSTVTLVGPPLYLDADGNGKVDTLAHFRYCGSDAQDDKTSQVLALTRGEDGVIRVVGRVLALNEGSTHLGPTGFARENDGTLRFVREVVVGGDAIQSEYIRVRWNGTAFVQGLPEMPVEPNSIPMEWVDWATATVDIPANGTGCAAGRAVFTAGPDGRVSTATVSGTTYRMNLYPRVPGNIPPFATDADRDGTLDVVLALDCVTEPLRRTPNLLLAVAVSDEGKPSTIGLVWSAEHRPDGYPYQYALHAYAPTTDGTIWLETRPWEGLIRTVCQIAWDGTAFRATCRP